MKTIILNVCCIGLCINIMQILYQRYKTNLNDILSWLTSRVNKRTDKLQKSGLPEVEYSTPPKMKLPKGGSGKSSFRDVSQFNPEYPKTRYEKKIE